LSEWQSRTWRKFVASSHPASSAPYAGSTGRASARSATTASVPASADMPRSSSSNRSGVAASTAA
jgi:hypothetical protein